MRVFEDKKMAGHRMFGMPCEWRCYCVIEEMNGGRELMGMKGVERGVRALV
jgi:hypothetical protein